ncbi:hypothetical protein GGR54DRAFT_646925 [Hypoxylon sp. NC1633]|nr:hypothetical protein GGR54DRAFT_646925 [Hypoxylon sp. NC1633]
MSQPAVWVSARGPLLIRSPACYQGLVISNYSVALGPSRGTTYLIYWIYKRRLPQVEGIIPHNHHHHHQQAQQQKHQSQTSLICINTTKHQKPTNTLNNFPKRATAFPISASLLSSHPSTIISVSSTITMGAVTFTTVPKMANQGRSGYNKDGDDEDDKRNFGRSGYNKDGDDEDNKRSFGRSGYNKDGDDEDDSRRFNFGRSGYN